MAKIVAPKGAQEQVEKVVETENNVVETTNQVEWKNSDMSAILERLEKLEKEGAELRRENEELKKGNMNVFVSWKEVYDGPRKYNYKLWWGIPVLGYKSFKKDPTKDLMYKDQFWQRKSNHYLKLDLADKTQVEVEVNEFNRDYTRSEKLFAEKVTDNRGNLLGFEFDTDDYWKIIVAENVIN